MTIPTDPPSSKPVTADIPEQEDKRIQEELSPDPLIDKTAASFEATSIEQRTVESSKPKDQVSDTASGKSSKKKKKKKQPQSLPEVLSDSDHKGTTQTSKVASLVPELASHKSHRRRGRPVSAPPAKSESTAVTGSRLRHLARQYGVAKGKQVDIGYEAILAEVNTALKKEGSSVYTHLALATLLMGEGRLEEAKKYAQLLLEESKPGTAMYARALLLKGKIDYFATQFITGETAEAFKTAWQMGNSQAAKFYMLSMMHLGHPRTSIKWSDLAKVIEVAEDFPDVHSQYSKKVSEYCDSAYQSGKAPLKAAAYVMISEVLNEVEPGAEFALGFACQLTKYFSIHTRDKKELLVKQQEIESKLKKATEHGLDWVTDLQMMLCYAVGLKMGATDSVFETLTAKDSAMIFVLLAGTLAAKNPERQSQAIALLESAKEFPTAYELLADLYMRKSDFVKARDTYREATVHIEQFLSGKRRLTGILPGFEAQRYAKYTKYSRLLKFEEQVATEQLLETFQCRLDLLEDICAQEAESRQTATTATGEVDSESDNLTENDSQASSLPPKAQAQVTALSTGASSPPDDSDTFGWEVVRRKVRTYGIQSIKNQLHSVSELTRSASGLAEAEKILTRIDPEKDTPQWYQKEQALCWINHEKGNPENYGKPDFTIPDDDGSALQFLRQAEEQATKSITKLEQLAAASGVSASESVRINEKECMKIAEALEDTDPALRRVYGGFYSTLGHLQKIFRGHSKTDQELDDCVSKGLDYYSMANFIRQREPSRFARPQGLS